MVSLKRSRIIGSLAGKITKTGEVVGQLAWNGDQRGHCVVNDIKGGWLRLIEAHVGGM